MSAPKAIPYKPTSLISHTILATPQSPKFLTNPQFLSSKSLFSGDFVPRRPGSARRRWPNTMSGSISAFKGSSSNGTGDDGFGALEQESFVPQFRPYFTSGGLETTLNRLSKWLVAALFGAVLLCRHDAEALWAIMGSVANAGLSTVLKKILNQERPVSHLRRDPGMPSSHAQSISFNAIFAITSMFQWFGANGFTVTLSVLTLAFSAYLSWLRVSQQLHTISQVVVGAALGTVFSILWFWSWDMIVMKAFISYLWVRVIIVLGAVGFCVGFFIYIIRNWITDEE